MENSDWKRQRGIKLLFVVLLSCLGTIPSSIAVLAYEIGPRIAGQGFDPVHQAMTTSAMACLERNTEEKPTNCIKPIKACIDSANSDGPEVLRRCFEKAIPRALYLGEYDAKDLKRAVRWPDDPTREASLSNPDSIGKFGLKMLRKCKELLEDRKGLDIKSGLLCNSHFGVFQFWHAQASSREEMATVTRQKILDWAAFNYQVAVGAVEAGEDYCDYFDQNPSSINDSMKPVDYPYCEERKYLGFVPKWLAKPYPAYDIATLYGLTCSNPFSSKTCTEKYINDWEMRAKHTTLSAIGALLHLVQDSYSQSHVKRGECEYQDPGNKEPVSKIECRPVEMFTNYAQYNAETDGVDEQNGHKHSDKWPSISESCVDPDRAADDPVTASAKVLWHVQQKSPIEDFLADLALASNEVDEDVTSGPGECYVMESGEI